MQDKKIKMKHLIKLLGELELNSVSELLEFIASIYIYEQKQFDELTEQQKALYPSAKSGDLVSVCTKINDTKCFEFVIAYKVCALNETSENAEENLTNLQTLYQLATEYSQEIYKFNEIVDNSPASDPNEIAAN